MSLTDKLGECRKTFNSAQIKAILDTFNDTYKQLVNVMTVTDETKEIKAVLDELKAKRDARETSKAIKTALDASVKELEKKYQEHMAAVPEEPVNVELVWNTNNGDKELLLPIKYKDIEGKKLDENSVLRKMYEEARGTIATYDIDCDVEDWNGYTRIISRGVAKKHEINIMSSDELTKKIAKGLRKEDTQNMYVVLSIINTRVDTDTPVSASRDKPAPATGYCRPHKRASALAQKPVKKVAVHPSKTIEELSDICELANIKQAAQFLNISEPSVMHKINKAIHGVKEGSRWYIPMHDLITYACSFARVTGDGRNHKFSKQRQDLTEERFAEYKAKLGNLYDKKDVARELNMPITTVNLWLNRGQLHGVKHKNQWYVPKVEVMLFKYLKKKESQ